MCETDRYTTPNSKKKIWYYKLRSSVISFFYFPSSSERISLFNLNYTFCILYSFILRIRPEHFMSQIFIFSLEFFDYLIRLLSFIANLQTALLPTFLPGGSSTSISFMCHKLQRRIYQGNLNSLALRAEQRSPRTLSRRSRRSISSIRLSYGNIHILLVLRNSI